jgi:hypothetical protein
MTEQKVVTIVSDSSDFERFFYVPEFISERLKSLDWHVKQGWLVKFIMANEEKNSCVVVFERKAGT